MRINNTDAPGSHAGPAVDVVADAEDVVARLAGSDAPARLLLEAAESSSHHALRGRDDVAHQVLRALQPTAVGVDGDPRAPRGAGLPP